MARENAGLHSIHSMKRCTVCGERSIRVNPSTGVFRLTQGAEGLPLANPLASASMERPYVCTFLR
jgi:hypothetical protein